jgi:predicted membrane metal-binding protein
MRKSRLKYPFLWPLGGLLIAYVALRLRVCTVHPDWIAGLFASLSLVFFGLSNGYKFSVKKGLLRLTAVVVFHAGLGFFWFSRNNLDKAESLERVLRSSSPNARALVLVRDTWMYGPRGCRGSVQCIGISQEKGRWKVCNVELRVRLNKKSGVPPALGYYWIDVNRIRLYDVPEIPGDPNWRNIMNGLGVAGYTFFDGDGSWLRIAKTAATSHDFYEIRSVCLIWLHESFYQYMSSPVAGLLYAMMVGDKSGLEDDINARFGAAGLLHVLAVSGMHVSLIMGVNGFWCPRPARVGYIVGAVGRGLGVCVFNGSRSVCDACHDQCHLGLAR